MSRWAGDPGSWRETDEDAWAAAGSDAPGSPWPIDLGYLLLISTVSIGLIATALRGGDAEEIFLNIGLSFLLGGVADFAGAWICLRFKEPSVTQYVAGLVGGITAAALLAILFFATGDLGEQLRGVGWMGYVLGVLLLGGLALEAKERRGSREGRSGNRALTVVLAVIAVAVIVNASGLTDDDPSDAASSQVLTDSALSEAEKCASFRAMDEGERQDAIHKRLPSVSDDQAREAADGVEIACPSWTEGR